MMLWDSNQVLLTALKLQGLMPFKFIGGVMN